MKKIEKIILILVVLNLFAINSFGQRTCGSEMNLDRIQQTDPDRYQRIMDLESQIQYIINRHTSRSGITEEIIIPVVVHVVYNNISQNISDEQIFSQIRVLNDDFRRKNSDAINTPAAFRNIAGSFNIKFKLATKDPQGDITDGITRTRTAKTGFSAIWDDVKFTSQGGKDAWNTSKYLNIWVCNFSDTMLLGYAQFPSDLQTKPNTDGVVINYKCFGTIGNLNPNFNKGRTTTHEVGHWLNLRHIWGDQNNCTATDFVEDTPNQYTFSRDCPTFPKTDACSPNSPGTMFMNYMDYSHDACMNMFTKGQVDRMLALFDPIVGIRKEILKDANELTTKTYDLFIRDDKDDEGYEPNPSPSTWLSPDIWLTDKYKRRIYIAPIKGSSEYFVAVRIKNRGMLPVEGAKLSVHWSGATFNSKWENSWVRRSRWGRPNNPPFTLPSWFPWDHIPQGAAITPDGGIDIPTIEPSKEKIVYVPWNMSFYDIIDLFFSQSFNTPENFDWGFSLLAFVEDGNDPLFNLVNYPTTEFAKRYNNVATHNARKVLISNYYSQILPFSDIIKDPFLIVYKQKENENYVLNDFAETYAILSNDMMAKLNFEKSSGIKQYSENRLMLTSPNAELHFYPIDDENEFYAIGSAVHFISDKLPQLNDFDFDITLYCCPIKLKSHKN